MSYLVIGILIIVGILWAIGAFIEWVGDTSKKMKARMAVKKTKTLTQVNEETGATETVVVKLNLIERNQDIIQEYREGIYAGDRSYYVENEVRDCIGKIAEREGRDDLVPKYREWLSNWETRSDIPQEYIELKDYLKESFGKKHKTLLAKERAERDEQEKEEAERLAKSARKLFEKNKDIIDKFLEIAERKVSVIDDYGDENWDILPEEINACLAKIARKAGVELHEIKEFLKDGGAYTLGEEYEWLQEELGKVYKAYHKAQTAKPTNGVLLQGLSGVEFEVWISKLLKENGFADVRGTPATGDQGADLIAKKDGKTIIIQAKRYQGTVGNKAVQEVISAVQFYRGDEGWVITNSTFTPSAKALAHRSNIKLVDGKMLENPQKFLK